MAKETLGATVSVFLLLGGIEAALYTYGTSVSLHKTLLQNYSKDIRPVTNQTKTLLIDIKLNIKAINKFDETEGVLHTVFGLTLEWTDELIQWNPTDYGQASIVRLPKSKVWIPSLFLVNSATSLEIELGNDKTQTVTYQANGSALCSTGIITSSMCSPNIMYYPFDNHDCSVQFSNLVPSKEISLRIDRRISTDVYEPNTWNLFLENISCDKEHRLPKLASKSREDQHSYLSTFSLQSCFSQWLTFSSLQFQLHPGSGFLLLSLFCCPLPFS